jgi:hypothetical protein
MNDHINLHVYSSIISINGFNIMVTLCIYFEYILKLYVRYLLNILCPYYKFIQIILLIYFKSLLKMKFIYYLYYVMLCYIYIYIIYLFTYNKK